MIKWTETALFNGKIYTNVYCNGIIRSYLTYIPFFFREVYAFTDNGNEAYWSNKSSSYKKKPTQFELMLSGIFLGLPPFIQDCHRFLK
jgi:hypothetical protein